jgi:hypothetical protein
VTLAAIDAAIAWPEELAMFALTLLHTLDRVRHEVLVPTWYWGLAICDGAAYLLLRR